MLINYITAKSCHWKQLFIFLSKIINIWHLLCGGIPSIFFIYIFLIHFISFDQWKWWRLCRYPVLGVHILTVRFSGARSTGEKSKCVQNHNSNIEVSANRLQRNRSLPGWLVSIISIKAASQLPEQKCGDWKTRESNVTFLLITLMETSPRYLGHCGSL